MVQRILMTPDRLLVSRAGFAADASMPHSEKAYDSDWAYAGQLIAAGWQDDPAAWISRTALNGMSATGSSAPWVIDFPECSFIPTVALSIYYSPTYELASAETRIDEELVPLYWEYIQVGTSSPFNNQARFTFEVTTSSIIVTRRAISGTGNYYRFRAALYYQIFGFAGP